MFSCPSPLISARIAFPLSSTPWNTGPHIFPTSSPTATLITSVAFCPGAPKFALVSASITNSSRVVLYVESTTPVVQENSGSVVTSYSNESSAPLVESCPAFSTLLSTPNTATSTVLSKMKSSIVLLYTSKVAPNLPDANSIPKLVSFFSSHFKSGLAALKRVVVTEPSAPLLICLISCDNPV